MILRFSVLNGRYKKVAYLDTDVGQTEFTPPVLLSLTVIDKVTPGWWSFIGFSLFYLLI